MKGRLVIFCGIPGSGKTTIAKLVLRSFEKSILIQSDDVRSMLIQPNFAPEESRFVYDACFGIAEEALKAGYFVVLDATFLKEDYREEARSRLGEYCERVDIVWVECKLDVALERNFARKAVVPPAKVQAMLDMFESPRDAICVDSTRTSAEAAAKRVVVDLLRRQRVPPPRT